MVNQRIKDLRLNWGVRMDYDLILEHFKNRATGFPFKPTKAFEENFSNAETNEEKQILKLILDYRNELVSELESELFKQKIRNNEAVSALEIKITKTKEKERSVSARQIERITKRLERIKDTKSRDNDSRIYAFDWAPVIVWEANNRVMKPMRYHLRPSFADESWDKNFGGCYNARRDKLTTSWKTQFGKQHGIIIVTSFFENVKKHDLEKRKLKRGEVEVNVVIEFNPDGMDYMVVPCIYDVWKDKKGTELYTFALITDEPPPEVLQTGHDRCPIFLNEARINDWLNPDGKSQKELFEILDDRERPFYKHSLAG